MSANDQIEHLITVSGAGVASAVPDVADVTIGVSVTQRAVKEARTQAAAAMSAVIDAVKKLGLPDRDIQTLTLSLSPTYNYNSGSPKLTGYQFSNSIRVTVRALDKLPAVIDEAAAVGATTIQSVDFRIGDPKRLEVEARKAAMADARSKADALAALAGVAIRGVASISESTGGGIPPRPMFAMAAMRAEAAPPTPVEAGTSEVSVNVTVSYLI